MALIQVPIVVTAIVGVVVLLDFFIKNPSLALASREFMNWGVIISAFATGLGAVNLLRIHLKRMQIPRERSVYSLVLLATLVGYTLLGIFTHSSSPQYKFVFDNALQPLSAAVFSFNAFFMTSAAYRAFRVKTSHATVLLIAALLMMLGRVGIGEVIYKGFPAVASWIASVPTTAGMRGFTIGAALGGMALSLRVILGLERSQFGGAGGGGQ